MAAPFDNHANLASSFVVTAPGLAGVSLTVVAGEGALFPLPPYNCTVCPANTFPTQGNAEIVRVTAKVGDTFTILRAQEGTTAKDIQAGFYFGNSITAKVITDIETLNAPTWGNISGDISDQTDLNNLIATFAQAGLTTGVVSETDTVLLSAPDNFTLRIAPLQAGIFSLLLGPGLPAETAIKSFPQTDFPLSGLGLAVDGTFTRWIGYTSAGVVVASTIPFTNDPNVIGIGFIAVKRVAGVVTFIDNGGPRSFATVPEMAGFSELERTYLRYASTVTVKWAAANMTVARSAGVINGTSVNWTGVGNKNSLAQVASSPASFIQINPASAAATVFPPVVTVLTATNYWNGVASVPLANNNDSSVKRFLLGIKGGLFVQEGEFNYATMDDGVANVSIAPFTTIFAQDTFIEIGRVVVRKNATNLSDPDQARFFVTGAAAGGSTASAISAVTSIIGTPLQIAASSPVGAVTLSLVNTPVVPGSYTAANITVDQQGRVTAAASGAAGGVTSVTGTANEITAAPTAGAVVVSLPVALTFTGKTVTGGLYVGGAFNGTLGATTPNTVVGTTGTFNSLGVSGNLGVGGDVQATHFNALHATNPYLKLQDGALIRAFVELASGNLRLWADNNIHVVPGGVTVGVFSPSGLAVTGALTSSSTLTVANGNAIISAGSLIVPAGQVAITIDGGGFVHTAATGTASVYARWNNASGVLYFGLDNNTATSFGTAGAYGTVIYRPAGTAFAISEGATMQFRVAAGGTVFAPNYIQSNTGVYVQAQGAAFDPYGAVAVMQPTGANYSYFGMTRSSTIGMGMGIDTSNRYWVGVATTATGSGALATQLGLPFFSTNANQFLIGTPDIINVASGAQDGVSIEPNGLITISKNNGGLLALRRRSGDGNLQVFFRDTTSVGSISVLTNTTFYNTTSDARLKENLRDYTGVDSGPIMDGLRPRKFDWKDSAGNDMVGFVAQEEAAVDPSLVRIGAVKPGDDDPTVITERWMRCDISLVPIIVAELKAIRARLKDAGL